jgi:hypothetical protein
MDVNERGENLQQRVQVSTTVPRAFPQFAKDESSRVLLRVGEDSTVMSAAAVRSWWSDYSLGRRGIGQTFDTARRREAGHDVQYIWRVHTDPIRVAVRKVGR